MTIEAIFREFQRLRVMIIGDVMIDRYWWGSTNRISPEAPVPILNFNQEEDRLGGAANVALNVRELGAEAQLYSVAGRDRDAESFFEQMENQGLSAQGILQLTDRPTTVKTRVIAQHQHLLRIDREHCGDLTEPDEQKLWELVENNITGNQVDLILLQDYNKGVLTSRLISRVIAAANTAGIPVAVDPKKKNFFAYQDCTLFKPNLREVSEALNVPAIAETKALSNAHRQLSKRLRYQLLLATLSEAGVFIAEGEQQLLSPTQSRDIVDVCGAGDSVFAVAALAVAIGLDLRTIGLLANLAGGQVCERVGVTAIDAEQLKKEFVRLAGTQ